MQAKTATGGVRETCSRTAPARWRRRWPSARLRPATDALRRKSRSAGVRGSLPTAASSFAQRSPALRRQTRNRPRPEPLPPLRPYMGPSVGRGRRRRRTRVQQLTPTEDHDMTRRRCRAPPRRVGPAKSPHRGFGSFSWRRSGLPRSPGILTLLRRVRADRSGSILS
jgi:hypothetical protein